jgi:APA family basic amino acid/polyamine antiporter
MVLSSIGSGMAHLILRRRSPLFERPYRTVGYPFVPLLFIVAYSYIAVQIFLSSPARSLLCVAITVSGIPFYLYAIQRKNKNAANGVHPPKLDTKNGIMDAIPKPFRD